MINKLLETFGITSSFLQDMVQDTKSNNFFKLSKNQPYFDFSDRKGTKINCNVYFYQWQASMVQKNQGLINFLVVMSLENEDTTNKKLCTKNTASNLT